MKKSSKKNIPKLFPRGKKGIYYFRVKIKGADKWVSTRTNDINKAESFADSYISGENYLKALLEDSKISNKQLAEKASQLILKKHTGEQPLKIPLNECHERWISLIPDYKDISDKTHSTHKAIFERFAEWCENNGIHYLEDVNNEEALNYAKHIWESGLAAKTYNEHIKHISRVLGQLINVLGLPCNNPFNKDNVSRKKKSELNTAQHQALEAEELKTVLETAAKEGEAYRDFFAIGAHTGMRLKDAALLKWESVTDKFINIVPYKTLKTGTEAHIPISGVLMELLSRRKRNRKKNEKFVIPEIAQKYTAEESCVRDKSQKIFQKALGKEKLHVKSNSHRKRNTAIYGYHSFRVTFMSLLASQDVSLRDAMRIMAWQSQEMVLLYEHLLEKYRGDIETRAINLINNIEELQQDIPDCPEPDLKPTKEALEKLIEDYSNVTIGKIYGISDVAISKWLKKFEIKRKKRIESPNLSNMELEEIREKIKENRK